MVRRKFRFEVRKEEAYRKRLVKRLTDVSRKGLSYLGDHSIVIVQRNLVENVIR